jgi:light-regulated signal transduction histidine kinase (bacteriophytochrome)
VADHLGDGSFSTDDERLAMALGAQFATAWDSLGLYTELEHLVTARTAELQSANRELEAFSYSVSHDLRAPLRAISGYTGILVRDHGPKLPPEAGKLCAQVQENASRMGSLIDDLLNFSRLGRKALSVQRLNLAHLARECLKELAEEQQGRKVEVTIADLPPCYGDVILLKQVLLNLLSNALKYTRKRDVARIEVGAEIRNGEYVCQVRDNGAGFDIRYADKLFEVFQRLHPQSEFTGTGVGLAIVRRAIEKHGGRVWVESAPDQGATFYFSLPAGNGAQGG